MQLDGTFVPTNRSGAVEPTTVEVGRWICAGRGSIITMAGNARIVTAPDGLATVGVTDASGPLQEVRKWNDSDWGYAVM